MGNRRTKTAVVAGPAVVTPALVGRGCPPFTTVAPPCAPQCPPPCPPPCLPQPCGNFGGGFPGAGGFNGAGFGGFNGGGCGGFF